MLTAAAILARGVVLCFARSLSGTRGKGSYFELIEDLFLTCFKIGHEVVLNSRNTCWVETRYNGSEIGSHPLTA